MYLIAVHPAQHHVLFHNKCVIIYAAIRTEQHTNHGVHAHASSNDAYISDGDECDHSLYGHGHTHCHMKVP